jgi:hypothetical protein
MQAVIRAGLALLAAASLASCATGPKPCTAEWVDWKTDRILNDFARDHQKQIASIRDLGAQFSSGGKADLSSSNQAQLALAAIGGLALIGDFAKDVAPKAAEAMSECSTAPKATQLLASMLRKQGVDEKTAQAVEQVGQLLDIDKSGR